MGLNLEDVVKQFLFDYRTTPHSATKQTPTKLMLRREFHTRFSLLRPREPEQIMYEQKNRQLKKYKGARQVKFKVGDPAMVADSQILHNVL